MTQKYAAHRIKSNRVQRSASRRVRISRLRERSTSIPQNMIITTHITTTSKQLKLRFERAYWATVLRRTLKSCPRIQPLNISWALSKHASLQFRKTCDKSFCVATTWANTWHKIKLQHSLHANQKSNFITRNGNVFDMPMYLAHSAHHFHLKKKKNAVESTKTQTSTKSINELALPLVRQYGTICWCEAW